MPRERLAASLPRWVSAPAVSDWVTAVEAADLVERERDHLARGEGSPSPCGTLTAEEAARRFAFVAAFGRWIEALDLTFGPDAWPSRWAGAAWQWEAAADGPPETLRRDIEARRANPTGAPLSLARPGHDRAARRGVTGRRGVCGLPAAAGPGIAARVMAAVG